MVASSLGSGQGTGPVGLATLVVKAWRLALGSSEHPHISCSEAGHTEPFSALGFFVFKGTEMQEKWCGALCALELTTPFVGGALWSESKIEINKKIASAAGQEPGCHMAETLPSACAGREM